MIDFLKYRKIYYAVSSAMILLGLFGLLKWGLNLGVEFTGGSIIEYRFENSISTEDLKSVIEEGGIDVQAVQASENKTYIVKTSLLDSNQEDTVNNTVKNKYGDKVEELRKENVGPSIGSELIKKTFYAIAIAASLILLWVAYQFKSVKYGATAILAMLHDTFILVSSFSILGHFFNAEADFLFVTAVLTTLSFSVHDTIVVFDRIREIKKKEGGELFNLANIALNETMVRSLNNSFTIMFMLIALILMGGSTIRWFSAALLIGTVLGTYSSPFVAVPLLVSWDEFFGKIRFRRK